MLRDDFERGAVGDMGRAEFEAVALAMSVVLRT